MRSHDFQAPRHSLNLMSRPQVNEHLAHVARNTLIYLCAPGGYGKTSSVALWLKGQRNKIAWLSCNKFDNIPQKFYSHLLQAICHAQPANKKLKKYIDNENSKTAPLENTLMALDCLLRDQKEYWLILDDFQLIENSEILQSFSLLYRKLEPYFRIIILSRTLPEGCFNELYLKGQLSLITEKALIFSKEEIKTLFQKRNCPLNEQQLEQIVQNTEGWAIGVNAYLLSCQEETVWDKSKNNATHYFEQYLDTQVWQRWSARTKMFLVKASVIDVLTPEICYTITKEEQSAEILNQLSNENAFIFRTDRDTYQLHHLFREFLLKKLEKLCSKTEISTLYINLGQWFIAQKEYFIASSYFAHVKDHDGIKQSLTGTRRSLNSNLEEYLQMLKNFLSKNLPDDFIRQNINLMTHFAWAHYLKGDKDNYLYYMDILKDNLKKIATEDIDLFKGVILLFILDFRQPIGEYLKNQIQTIKHVLKNTAHTPAHINTNTVNLPFAHRSIRDYSEFAQTEKIDLSPTLSTRMLIGREFDIMDRNRYAGLLFERNQLQQAHEYVLEAHRLCDDKTRLSIIFLTYMQTISIIKAMQIKHEVTHLEELVEKFIEEHQAFYLKANFRAYLYEEQIRSGNRQLARQWLENYAAKPTEHLEFHKIFQHFTTAKACIVAENFTLARLFAQKLLKLSDDYQRPLDQIETHIILAIAYWYAPDSDRQKATEHMIEAISTAQKYRYTMRFIHEAGDILPIVQNIKHSRKKLPAALNTNFLEEILYQCKKHKLHVKKLVEKTDGKEYRLSKKQKEVLCWLAKTNSHEEIAQNMNVKISTIKTHLARIYKELGVHCAKDALEKVKNLRVEYLR